MANIVFGSADLSALGLVTPGVSGAHDLAGVETIETWLPGRDTPAVTTVRRTPRVLTFRCGVFSETSHADLVSKLGALKVALSPTLGYCFLEITDLTAKHILAQCQGFPVNVDTLPYLTRWVEFTLTFKAASPYFEDATALTNTVAEAAATGSIDNTGDAPCFPVYTCTVGAAPLAGGLTFTVNGKTFTYSGALAAADVLVVSTDLPDVTRNGAKALSGTLSTTQFPELVTSLNAITAKTAGFTLLSTYRRQYE